MLNGGGQGGRSIGMCTERFSHKVLINIVMRSLLILLLFVFSCLAGYAQQNLTIHVEEAGTLNQLLSEKELSNSGIFLKITGLLNSEDFKAIKEQLTNKFFSLDLSEAEFAEIPERAFCSVDENGSSWHIFLQKIILPPSLTTINKLAFGGCEALKEVDLSRCTKLNYVGGLAFGMCKLLSSIDFSNCTELKVLGNEVQIGPFQNCNKLESVILPPNLEVISYATFESSNLKYIEIPFTVKEIEENAFKNVTYLNEIKMNPQTPPVISNSTFHRNTYEYGILKVPSGSLSKYKAAEYWKDFTNIEEYNPNGGDLIYHTIQVSYDNGSVRINGDYIEKGSSVSFTDQTDIQLLIEPKYGYHLKQVMVGDRDMTDDVKDKLLTLPSISCDQMITITFGLDIYTVQVSYNDGGMVKVNDNTVTTSGSLSSVIALSTVKVTITPEAGYHIKQVLWFKTDVTNQLRNNVLTISSINYSMEYTVVFEKDAPATCTVKVTYSEGGSIKLNDQSVTSGQSTAFKVSTDVKVAITPQPGYHIKQVMLGNNDVTSQLSNDILTISSISVDKELVVTFEKDTPITYAIILTCSYGGSVKVNNQSITSNQSAAVAALTDVKVTITPQAGYRIKQVKLKGEDVTNQVSDNVLVISTISANVALSITFEQIPTYKLNISITGGSGSIKIGDKVITESTQISDIKEGNSILINFQLNDYYEVKKVSLGDEDITSNIQNGFYEIKSVNTNLILNIEYVRKQYKLLIDIQGADKMKINGKYVTDGSYIVINSGSNSIQIISEHYFIKEVLLDDKIVYIDISDESQSYSSSASFDENILSDKKLTIITKLRDKRIAILTLDEPGTLASHLSEDDMKLITDLDIKGKMDQRDFVVFNQMQSLFKLNLQLVTIEKYSIYPANTIPEKAFYNNKSIKIIYLPYSIKAIDNQAFSCSVLSSFIEDIDSYKYLSRIGEDAFKNCQYLINGLACTNNVVIEKGVYENCTNLKSVYLPIGLVEIKEATFRNCKNLSITLGLSLERIGDYAFEGVKEVKFTPSWQGEAKLSHIGTNALKGCQNYFFDFQNVPYLKELPCFEGCTNMNSITLPPNIKEISEGIFKGCTSLHYVKMNENIERIAENAFSDSKSIENLYVPAKKVPEVSINSFSDFTYNGAKLFVPADQLPYYRNHSVWGKFKNIEPTGTATYRKFGISLTEGGGVKIKGDNGLYIGEDFYTEGTYNNSYLTSSLIELVVTPKEGYSIESVHLNGENITNGFDENNTYVIPYLLVDSQFDVKFKKDNTTGLEMINADKRVYLSGTNQLSLSGFRIGAHVFVYDTSGRLVLQTIIRDHVEKIDLPGRGIYFIRIDNESVKIIY